MQTRKALIGEYTNPRKIIINVTFAATVTFANERKVAGEKFISFFQHFSCWNNKK